jgi:cysteinyl-tRNA synthetase
MSQKKPRSIRLSNTLSGKKELLETKVPGKLTMYSCGPTVYGLIHIGNLRGALVSDLFFRYFQRAGYEVNYVRNYTDVDDKIIQRANQEGVSSDQVSKKYISEVERDFAVASVQEPTHKTLVTTHMPEILAMIEKLIERGKAYVVDGEVLFAIDQFPGYGKLSRKPLEDLIAGMRVEVSSKKRNPLDFTLWKPAKAGEPSWESSWGPGRPGWHIECSAMASRWLGDEVDVHHGGEDLIFPHHENEIAQSEGACGHSPFVRYWLHHAFLTMSKEKMSKSLGNILTAREFLTRFSGEVARMLLLSVHYRSPIDYCDEVVEQALNGLQRIYETKARAQEVRKQSRARADLRAEAAWGEFAAHCEKARRAIDDCYANDFNTAGALGELFSLIREFNRTLAEPLAQATPAAVLGAEELIRVIEDDIGGVIGVGRLEAGKALEDFSRIRRDFHAPMGEAEGAATRPTPEEIEASIEKRKQARAAKDFAAADGIRKDLEKRGVIIKDTPQGTTWSYQ